MAAFLGRKVIISASILLMKAWLGSELGDSGSRNPSHIKKAFKSPNYYGAQLWDNLPLDTQLSGSYKDFKGKVRRHITAGMFDQV